MEVVAKKSELDERMEITASLLVEIDALLNEWLCKNREGCDTEAERKKVYRCLADELNERYY